MAETTGRVISLRKDRVISLTKDGNKGSESISFVEVGLKWGKIQTGTKARQYTQTKTVYTGNWFQKLLHIGPSHDETEVITVGHDSIQYESVDLDASICVYDKGLQNIETIYYGHLKNYGSSITHSADDLNGSDNAEEEKGDNETMTIDFTKLPKSYQYLVVILNSYRHHKFDKIPYAKMSIYEAIKGTGVHSKVFAEYNIDNNPDFIGKEALCLGVFYKTASGEWQFKADGTATKERSITEMIKGSALEAIKKL